MNLRHITTLALAAVLMLFDLTLVNSGAHAAVGGKDDRCVIGIGSHSLRLAAYQPGSTKAEYCGEIPKAGATVLALEALEVEEDNRELRATKAELRIINDVGQEAEAKAKLADLTVAYLPPTSFSGGVVNLQHDFEKTGKYIALITVRGDKNTWVARYPLSVGVASAAIPKSYLLIGGACIAILVLGAAVQIVLKREEKKKKLAS